MASTAFDKIEIYIVLVVFNLLIYLYFYSSELLSKGITISCRQLILNIQSLHENIPNLFDDWINLIF